MEMILKCTPRAMLPAWIKTCKHGSFKLSNVKFILNLDRGLLKLLGPDVFRDIFGIHSREEIVKTSLTFVIDVTGSMSDDIAKVKTATKNTLNEAKDSDFVPMKYVLVTFSDQGLYLFPINILTHNLILLL